MDAFSASISTVLDWFAWGLSHKDLLSMPAVGIGIATAVWTGSRYAIRQLDTYRFLSRFFDDPQRANREWWSGRMWKWWGALRPIDRARIRAELDILQQQGPRPKGRRIAAGKARRSAIRTWRSDRDGWEELAQAYQDRLINLRETHADRIKKMSAAEFERLAPVLELGTPADLDAENRRDRIVKYFTLLEELTDAKKHYFGSFLTYIKFSDGYIAPAFLIAGLMSRFNADWSLIIGNYRSVLNRKEAPISSPVSYSRELEELRSFQFNCWLLWGPSIPLCTCGHWQTDRTKQGAAHHNIIMQYGFGDEANCVDFMIESDTAEHAYRDWLRSIDDPTFNRKRGLPAPGEPRHVGAIPGALIGQIMWGPKINELDICEAQRKAVRGLADSEFPARVVLNFTKRIEAVPQDEEVSNYYSAYVWVMFALTRKNGDPVYSGEGQAHRNLLPFFEHGNIADATTLQTIKESLVAKSLSALAEVVGRAADDEVQIAYVGACDHSGCGHKTRYPQSKPIPMPDAPDQPVRPPRILELLKAERPRNRYFMNPRFAGRLILPETEETPTLKDGRFASCHLPEIVEQFMGEVSRSSRSARAAGAREPA